MKDDSRYRSRKFILAASWTALGTLALFYGKISGTDYVLLGGAVLGLYGYANAKSKGNDIAD